ncbi:hypothetical protein PHMEG_00016109 [Phytophthora megakarya]|uniref:SWIM-type domain-containing protein n=1 Tax=Phytophthora megakarya TaxID=4795 RepID=A0A225W035_9STRA|nr:hypothetical protein PHMEG_00016109 [Phytophthora megakarya]
MLSSLVTLLSWQRRIEEEYLTRVEMPGTLRNAEYSEQMNIVIGMKTRWEAEAIETQYKVASNMDISAGYSFKNTGDHVIISNGNHEHQLQKDTLQCDCEFSKTMKLPCRHAMVYK